MSEQDNQLQQLQGVEDILIAHKDDIPVRMNPPLLFKPNIIRKASPHRCVCLTVFDSTNQPIFVLKAPENQSPLANISLNTEYVAIKNLSKIPEFKADIPQPLSGFEVDRRMLVLQNYVPHTMLFELHEIPESRIPRDHFTAVFDWLFKFNSHYAKEGQTISQEFMTGFFETLNSNITENYAPMVEVVKMCRNLFGELFDNLTKADIPLVFCHMDFNSYNIGIKEDNSLVIFDWEDAKESYPILFDFFYFIIMYFWQVFWTDYGNKVWDRAYIEKIHPLFMATIKKQLNRFCEAFNITENYQLNMLFIMFLLNNLTMEAAEKRKSPVQSVNRWMAVLNTLNGDNYVLNYFETQLEVMRQNMKFS